MHRSVLAILGAVSALIATPAFAAAPPADGTFLGGCTTAFTNPDALACQGYYSGNLLNGSEEDRGFQADAIFALTGDPTIFDGSLEAWNSAELLKIDAESGALPIDFGIKLFGLNVIGAHFGNGTEITRNNVSVFWLIDFGTEGGFLTLANSRGWSNAVLYTPPGEVPEPATWAMMLLGFGAAGSAMRRNRRRNALLTQIA